MRAGSLAWGSGGLVIVMIVAAAVAGGTVVWDFSWSSALPALGLALAAVAAGRAYLVTRREEEITGRRKP